MKAIAKMNVGQLDALKVRVADAKREKSGGGGGRQPLAVSDNIARRMKIGDAKVVDAVEKLPIRITAADVRRGATKNASACAAAQAICRSGGFTEARVHAARTYVKDPSGKKWFRFVTPPALRNEIIAFDRGGTFEPGEYELIPIQPSQSIGARASRKGYESKKKGTTSSPKRKNHVTTGMRSRFMPG